MLDKIIEAIDALGDKIINLLSRMISTIIKFIEKCYKAIKNAIIRICSYIKRLFEAIGKLIISLGILILIYVPGIFCIVIGITKERWGVSVFGLIFFKNTKIQAKTKTRLSCMKYMQGCLKENVYTKTKK